MGPCLCGDPACYKCFPQGMNDDTPDEDDDVILCHRCNKNKTKVWTGYCESCLQFFSDAERENREAENFEYEEEF